MTDDEYVELIELSKGWLERLGLGGLAEDEHYLLDPNEDDFRRRLLAPRDHLVAILSAFERHVQVFDGALARVAMHKVNESLSPKSERISDFRLEMITRETDDLDLPVSLSLLEVPNRKELREILAELLGNLRESGTGELEQ